MTEKDVFFLRLVIVYLSIFLIIILVFIVKANFKKIKNLDSDYE